MGQEFFPFSMEMNSVTQQFAANAEASASAALELNAQYGNMKGLVGELVALVGGDAMGYDHTGSVTGRRRFKDSNHKPSCTTQAGSG
jgi:hypothetical protein